VAAAGREEIVCLKGAQIGWSELCRNIARLLDRPGPRPVLILMPDQKSAEDFREERIEPLMKHTRPSAARQRPRVGQHEAPDQVRHLLGVLRVGRQQDAARRAGRSAT
jgi:phage terminase large subunit GpA-like protein